MKENWKIETQAVQGGYWPENTESRVVPLVQSTTFKYDSCEELAKVFDLEQASFMYTRIGNPTTDVFEKKMALMDKGVGALATASGMAATTLAILNVAKAGDSIISASTIYGGSFTLFGTTFKDLGIEVIFVDPWASEEEILACAKDNTKAVFAETIANPKVNVIDFEKFSNVSKKLGVPFMVDNTFATPVLCRPIEHGANIVIYSTSKYIDGHASALGGCIVDGGNFDWNSSKFPGFIEPDTSYHGLVYAEKFQGAAFIVKARVQLMRNLGVTPAPFNSYLTNLGMETLHLRMERHSENALAMAKYLENHPMCTWVNYPGLESSDSYELVQKYLPKGASGVLSFGVKGGREAASKFIDSLELILLVTHVSDVRSSVIHPASTTHRQLSDEELMASGATADTIRFSVGIESVEDLIADFEQAFEKCK